MKAHLLCCNRRLNVCWEDCFDKQRSMRFCREGHRNPVADAEIQRWSYKVDPDLSASRAALNCDCKPLRSYMSLILCMFSFGEKEWKSP